MDSNTNSPISSISVACLSCRDKHLKCDGNPSGCARCCSLNMACQFIPSRRGRKTRPSPYILTQNTDFLPGRTPGYQQSTGDLYPITPINDLELFSNEILSPGPVEAAPFARPSLYDDRLLSLFYSHFYLAHPFLPPKDMFIQSQPPRYILNVVEFIGMHYLPTYLTQEDGSALLSTVKDADACVEKVQALLLLSIILHARCQPTEAKYCMAQAMRLGLDLGIHRRQVSEAVGVGDPVRAESLRRTWWELFVTDSLLAAVQADGYLEFDMPAPDVPLPCEEDDYANGLICSLLSVRELEGRAFCSDDRPFSSFAFRIEAAIILREALLAGTTASTQSVDMIDARITGWFHHLPRSKRSILHSSGEVDETIFQAVMIIHCACIYLHFPRSYLVTLLPVTGQILCAQPRAVSFSTNPEMHTAKVAHAAIELSKLASLSTSVIRHSPFFVCTMVISSIIQLAAFSIQEQQSIAHRHFLALNVGVLKSMGDTWTIASTSMQRIRDAAMEVQAACVAV